MSVAEVFLACKFSNLRTLKDLQQEPLQVQQLRLKLRPFKSLTPGVKQIELLGWMCVLMPASFMEQTNDHSFCFMFLPLLVAFLVF